MNNVIQRKITSLTLMTIMLAGGMTFAMPGMIPAAHADGDLTVSAQEVGNFAGIQVIEIVVNDSDRSDTSDAEGRPNVELNGHDVYMAQATDGSWYAYVANYLAVEIYEDGGDLITNLYDADEGDSDTIGNSDSIVTYSNATSFLDGSPEINKHPNSAPYTNNDEDAVDNWPFIQTYDISTGSDVTITYGTGSTAESIELKYEYDDSKDISLDRSLYPGNSYVNISLDDSLLNLSPVADEVWVFDENGVVDIVFESHTVGGFQWESAGFEEGPFSWDFELVEFRNTEIDAIYQEGDQTVLVLRPDNTNENLFINWDNKDKSNIVVTGDGESFISYNSAHSIVYDTFDADLSFVNLIDEWFSGVEIDFDLTDEDRNLTSLTDETMEILGGEVPYIQIGDPITIDEFLLESDVGGVLTLNSTTQSKVAQLKLHNSTQIVNATVAWPTDYAESINATRILPYVSYDFTAFEEGESGLFYAGDTIGNDEESDNGIIVKSNGTHAIFEIIVDIAADENPEASAYIDLLFFGQNGVLADDNGELNDNIDRINDAIYRFELDETDDNTGKFSGTVEYVMINQLNVFEKDTYDNIDVAGDAIVIIVNDDMDEADGVTVSYSDFASTNVYKTVSDKEDANTHNGKITFDQPNYSSGNTVTVTVEDADLNTNSDTVQSYTVFEDISDKEWIGNNNVWLAQLLVNGQQHTDDCEENEGDVIGLQDSGFTLKETGDATGIFVGTLQLPSEYCDADGNISTTNGEDLEFEYQDYSDASGNPNETSASAAIRSNTGSVSLDRSVYPVPFDADDFPTYGNGTPLDAGDVKVVIRVNDADFNVSPSGEDTIDTDKIELFLSRGSSSVNLTEVLADSIEDQLQEIDPKSGIFEVEILIPQQVYQDYDDPDKKFGGSSSDGIIHQGDILSVTYTDPNDASGDVNTVTDSATLDLRNGVLQSDKSVFIIGSDAIITLIDPDLNLDSESAETWSLDLINWDSDAGSVNLSDNAFNAQPAGLRETGDNTGIFQVVIEIPRELDGDALERGEEIVLEYNDQGPAGADYVGDDDEDINVTIYTSNFGATVSLDQKVYTWTDKVYITIVSPDHNFDSDAIDEIGGEDSEINVASREAELEFYKFVETGTDTGIFTAEVILTGFSAHDADGDGEDTDASGITSLDGGGPTDGLLGTSSDSGLSVAFEFSDGEVVIGSSLIRWNIGEIQWLEASYPASGSGVIRVIDPDMNLKPEAVDSFDVIIWSDTVTGGITLRVTETNEATGIFEGTVFFTVNQASSGSRLSVSEGDTVTAKYIDHTLPKPYSTATELDVTATTLIGTLVPPLERAPAANLRTVDAFGNSLDTVKVDQQVQVTASLANGQDRDQDFAYLLQVQDENGVTVSLSWITGKLGPGQSFSPAVSWNPSQIGVYVATVFVWESVDNPTALSPPVTTEITVNG